MKKVIPILAILCMAACSKKDLNPWHHEVTWRFVFYDSNYQVVDSSPEMRAPDSTAVTMLGPGVLYTLPVIPTTDTEYWPEPARFFLVTGPATLVPFAGDTVRVPNGGCAFNVFETTPILDRTGWMLQRTENGKRINMFAQIQGGYDGKYNDFPYPEYINGIPYPWVGELDNFNDDWLCGSTQGSCQLAPGY